MKRWIAILSLITFVSACGGPAEQQLVADIQADDRIHEVEPTWLGLALSAGKGLLMLAGAGALAGYVGNKMGWNSAGDPLVDAGNTLNGWQNWWSGTPAPQGPMAPGPTIPDYGTAPNAGGCVNGMCPVQPPSGATFANPGQVPNYAVVPGGQTGSHQYGAPSYGGQTNPYPTQPSYSTPQGGNSGWNNGQAWPPYSSMDPSWQAQQGGSSSIPQYAMPNNSFGCNGAQCQAPSRFTQGMSGFPAFSGMGGGQMSPQMSPYVSGGQQFSAPQGMQPGMTYGQQRAWYNWQPWTPQVAPPTGNYYRGLGTNPYFASNGFGFPTSLVASVSEDGGYVHANMWEVLAADDTRECAPGLRRVRLDLASAFPDNAQAAEIGTTDMCLLDCTGYGALIESGEMTDEDVCGKTRIFNANGATESIPKCVQTTLGAEVCL